MEMLLFQRAWHGIDLTSLPAAAAAKDKPAGAEFYAQFYRALAAGQGGIDSRWLENKRRLGDAIEREIIIPWRERIGRDPKILALAAGKAPVERVWSERGHEVTFNDCQDDSLADLRREFPAARFLIGDATTLSPAGRYDLITAITLEYVMDRGELVKFLARAKSWLQPRGQIILYSASTLSFRHVAVETVKRILGTYRRRAHVCWGYMRTPGEFFSIAHEAGLRVVASCGFAGGAGGKLNLRARTPKYLPPLRDPNLIVILEPK